MKKFVYRVSTVLVPIIIGFSVAICTWELKTNNISSKFLLESENDYRLKFVDSADFELGVSETEKVLFPVDIIDAREENGYICIVTHENAAVMAPIDCVVKTKMPNGEITVGSGNISCILSGLLSGVEAGQQVKCGEVVGTVKGTQLYIQVYWGTRKLSLDELRTLL